MNKWILVIMMVLMTVLAAAGELGSTSGKKWAWKPLFNHNANRVVDGTVKDSSKGAILKKLVEFLKNEDFGIDGEFVSQKENDVLLRMVVAAQLKAVEMVQLIQDYNSQASQAVKEICLTSLMQCEDGRNVLVSFMQIQNRIEEIEAGRVDLEGMPEEQKEVFLGRNFLCFYYDFQETTYLEKFKKQHIEELRSFVKKVKAREDHGLVQSLFKAVTGESSEHPVESPMFSETEITSILQGWDQRLIVAKCWTRERIQQWKKGFLKTSMPEVLDFRIDRD
jgi:hypothetical protein